MTIGDASFKPLPHSVGQIHGLAAKMDSGQAMHTLEILNRVPATLGVADFGDSQEPDYFVFRHNSRTRHESTIAIWQNRRKRQRVFFISADLIIHRISSGANFVVFAIGGQATGHDQCEAGSFRVGMSQDEMG